MKILYIHHEYHNRRARYANEMRALGHKVCCHTIRGKKKPGQFNLKNIKSISPDLIWLLSPFYISEKVITDEAYNYIKAKNIPIVLYSTFSTGTSYKEMMDTWGKIDFLFLQNKTHSNYLKKQGFKSFYMPLAFYPDQYYFTVNPKSYPITFMGNPQTTVPKAKDDTRVKYITALQPFGIKVYGTRFNEKGIPASSFSTHKEQCNVYSKSKINLGLPFINSSLDIYKNIFHIKNRFFEIPATGNFLLMAKYEDFMEILDPSLVGYYDNNIDALVDTVKKYLKEETLRQKMAEKAYNGVHNSHTFSHRFKKMFTILKNEGI